MKKSKLTPLQAAASGTLNEVRTEPGIVKKMMTNPMMYVVYATDYEGDGEDHGVFVAANSPIEARQKAELIEPWLEEIERWRKQEGHTMPHELVQVHPMHGLVTHGDRVLFFCICEPGKSPRTIKVAKGRL